MVERGVGDHAKLDSATCLSSGTDPAYNMTAWH